MSAGGLHISISAEPVAHFGNFTVSNSMLTSLVVSALLITFAFAVRFSLKQTNRPSGLQNFAEWMMEGLISLVHGVTGSEKRTRHFLPFVASFFLFIMMNNWLGLVPGVGTIGYLEKPEGEEHAQLSPSQVTLPGTVAQASTEAASETTTAPAVKVVDPAHTPAGEEEVVGGPIDLQVEAGEVHEEATTAEAEHAEAKFVPYFRAGTADLNTTIALAFVSVFMTQVFGVMYLKLSYFGKFFNFSSPIGFFVGILELILEFAKIISFAFRLFGNIFAGEVLLAVITFLVPLVVPMPFYGLEVVVGVIQALVFSMLSVVFFNMATIGHDDH